jgi:5,10-methylenetetrahydromethanopterin reductase
MVKRLALTFYSVLKMPVRDIIECSIAAEKAGFEYITVAESFYRDGFALASVIAANVKKVKFGTSVMPIFTRTPFQLAMGAATFQELSEGRLAFLGLGVGYRGRTEQYFGVKQFEHVERMLEYMEVIRKLLSGEATTYHGKYFDFENFPRLTNYSLNIPIYFGSSAPKMLELAGRVADGVILNSISTLEYVKFALERISEGARSVGRDPSEVQIGHSIIYSVSDDIQKAIDAAKEDILFYLSYPELDPVIEKSPFKADAVKTRELYSKGRKKEAIALVSDEMLDDFAVYGTPGDCKVKLSKFIRRGIGLPIIRVSVTSYKETERKSIFMNAIDSLTN